MANPGTLTPSPPAGTRPSDYIYPPREGISKPTPLQGAASWSAAIANVPPQAGLK